MTQRLPGRAGVVVIGGGIVGCSVAYHLTRAGFEEVVLLERGELTCGTTWHAAGLVGQLRATRNLTSLARYSGDLYERLEEETGQATGFVRNGSLAIATNPERRHELLRGASMARSLGIETEEIDLERLETLWPGVRTSDVVCALHVPGDGVTNPVDTTQALARGARQRGAAILEDTTVLRVASNNGRIVAVETNRGEIVTDTVVNCAGLWARSVGKAATPSVDVPLHAAEHFYLVTESLPEFVEPTTGRRLPTLRDPEARAYFKGETGGKLLIGFFEARAKPWGHHAVPEDRHFARLEEDWQHLEPEVAAMTWRLPRLEDAGIELLMNGPESFTPDNRYLLGPAHDLDGYWVAAGFNSIGIQSAGGVGKVLAEWMKDGEAPMDLWDVELSRTSSFHANHRYLEERTVEAPGLLYGMHWPHLQPETARGLRRSPLHEHLRARGACFGEASGWERPNWYAAEPGKDYEYTYGRGNWFSASAREHHAVRNGIGLFDMSSFSKLEVAGSGATSLLRRLCANDVCGPLERATYTQLLNERGGIEADLTITRLEENRYRMIGYAATARRDREWLERHVATDEEVVCTDVTSAYAVLALMGPKAGALLGRLTDASLEEAEWSYGTTRKIDVGFARVRAARLSYVGEWGWELYVPTEMAVHVYEELVRVGEPLELAPAGYHALASLRIEKGYREWGHDLTPDDTPIEAGLRYAVSLDDDREFLGREAIERQLEAGRTSGHRKRLLQFSLAEPEEADAPPAPLLFHDEPIWRDGEVVGRVTSGAYGHTVGASLALGWVELEEPVPLREIASGDFEIEVAGERFEATASRRPPLR